MSYDELRNIAERKYVLGMASAKSFVQALFAVAMRHLGWPEHMSPEVSNVEESLTEDSEHIVCNVLVPVGPTKAKVTFVAKRARYKNSQWMIVVNDNRTIAVNDHEASFKQVAEYVSNAVYSALHSSA